MKRCIICGAAKNKEQILDGSGDCYIIAADGGYDLLKEQGIEPDVYVGDFDSTDFKSLEGLTVLRHPVRKDDTDMGLSIKHAIAKGYDEIFIYGGTGGERMDHTFANICLLKKYAQEKIRIFLIAANEVFFAICNEGVTFPADYQGIISVLSLTDVSKNVQIEGLSYEYQGDMTSDYPLGVSNEFVEGKEGKVAVEDGVLLISCQRNNFNWARKMVFYT